MKKLTSYFLLFIFLSSCSSTKYVNEDDLLLIKNTVFIDSTKTSSNKFSDLILQKPNSKSLGAPLSLYFYNLSNPKGAENTEQWQKVHPKWSDFFAYTFSEKQSISVAKSAIKFNEWFLKNGEAPSIITSKKTINTEQNLRNFLFTEGYFRSKVTSKTDTLDLKKGGVNYYISKGRPSILDTISVTIASPVLDSIYRSVYAKSFLKQGQQYNNNNFVKEAERIVKLYRNKGVYHFNENSILFNNDTLQDHTKTKVEVLIADRLIEKNGNYISKPFKTQTIKQVNVFTNYIHKYRNTPHKDTIKFENINFLYRERLKYKPKHLAQSIFIRPGQLYNDSLRSLTRNHLRGLKNFKTTSIRYTELNDDELEANIYLTPIEKYTLGLETELSRSNIRNFDISAETSISNKNIFKGAEIFKFSVTGSYFSSGKASTSSTGILGWEVGGNISLEVPRFMMPFGLRKLIPKEMYPKTTFHTGINFQKNIALDKQNISLGIDYSWRPTPRTKIGVEVMNAQYIRNLNPGNYFNIYSSEYSDLSIIAAAYGESLPDANSVSEIVTLMNTISIDGNFKQDNPDEYEDNLNILNRYNIITSNFLIPEIAYNHTYNTQVNIKDNNFYYLKVRLANSGNLLGLLSNATNSNNQATFLDLPIAEYFKTDIEYKKYWQLGQNSVLAHRTFLGAIFSYNNSDIPFSRSYFAGGSNDIRAWQTYNLGPGTRTQGLEYNIGSLKILSSLEYRFDLVGSLKSALFIDSGNIWDITNSSLVDDESKFSGIKSLTDVAVGGGLGLRYDFKFLIARLDLGFKFREPYRTEKKWFRNTNFGEVIYNIGINYPF